MRKVLQFRISLVDTIPEIWRRIQISDQCTFWDLHVALQDSMGWEDCHLHQFILYAPKNKVKEAPIYIGIPDDEDILDNAGIHTLAGWDIKVSEYLSTYNPFGYIYDFGDSWEHYIEFEGIYTQVESFYEISSAITQSVIAILEKLKFKHKPGEIVNCVLDNAKYQKSLVIQEYIAANPNIKLHYLPAYSPNLNLIERLWKFMHKHVTNNCYYEHFETFRYSLLSFLRNIDGFKDDLKSLLTFKFQKLNYSIANFVK